MLNLREIDKEFDFIALHNYKPECYPYVLESTAYTQDQQVYSLLFAYPSESVALDQNGTLSIKAHNSGSKKQTNRAAESLSKKGDFCSVLDDWFECEKNSDINENNLPFIGGWFVYAGYELANSIEPKLQLPPANDGLPVAFATRVHAALIFNHNTNKLMAIAEQDYGYLLNDIAADIDQCLNSSNTEDTDVPAFASLIEDDPDFYLNNVRKIKQYIKDGDVFQVNLSRKW